jgi:Flp pilus assembly protein TadD/cytochrome c oxidase subunit IV
MIYLASQRRLFLASMAATAAFACKPSGLIVTAALLGYEFCLLGALSWKSGLRDRSVLTTITATIWTIVLLAAQLLLYRWSNLNERLEDLARASGYLGAVLSLCPDQLLIMVVATLGTLVYLTRGLLSRWRGVAGSPGVHDQQAMARVLLLIGAWLVIGATVTSIVVYVRVYSVRYLLLALPFLYAVLAVTVLRHLNRGVLALVATLAVTFNLANWNGAFFPTVSIFRRHCSALERSHEYLADHRSNIAAMRELETKYADDTIVAGFPFPYYLSYPRLGYVSRPLHGYSINPFAGSAFPQVARLFDDPPARLTFINVDNPNYVAGAIDMPPPVADDEILYDDHQLAPLLIYRRSVPQALQADAGARNTWYLELLWRPASSDRQDLAKLLPRAQQLVKFQPAAALEYLRLANAPDNFDVRMLRAQALLGVGRSREAAEMFHAAAELHAEDANVQLQLGDAWLVVGDGDLARQAFEAAVRLDPQLALAWQRLGLISLQAKQFGIAVDQLHRAIAAAPLDPVSHNALGVALANQQDWRGARAEFARAVELDPSSQDARGNLREADRMLGTTTPGAGT